MARSFESAFHTLLVRKIETAQKKDADNLIAGSALALGDAVATSQRYSEALGYRRALCDVTAWCDEVVQDLLKD